MSSEFPNPVPGTVAGSSTGRRILPSVFFYFLVAGAGTVMLGPALPLLAARWSLPDSGAGGLFFAFFAGQFCGSWLATPRLRRSLILGAAGSCAALLVLAFTGVALAGLALFCTGLGLGAGLTAGNVIVGTIDHADFASPGSAFDGRGTSRSRLLAWLNVSWGVGAISCPLLLDASLHLPDAIAARGQVFFVGLAAAFGACAVMLGRLLPGSPVRHREESARRPGTPWQVFGLFGAILVLYVGVENSLGGWLPTYAERLTPGHSAVGLAATVALCFWIGELAGRALTALLLRRVNERLFFRSCLLVVIVTIAVLIATPRLSIVGLFALTGVAAMSLSPLFPLGVSFLLGRTGNHPLVGRVFASASLGGTVLPWLTGYSSTHLGSLRVAFAVPLAGAVLILLLSSGLARREEARGELQGDPASML